MPHDLELPEGFKIFEPDTVPAGDMPEPPPAAPSDYEWASGGAQRRDTARSIDLDRVEPLPLVDPTTLAGIEPTPRQWLVPDWIPYGHLTTLWGASTVGKTYVLQQLGMACATGSSWFGLEVRKGKVLGFFAEDDN